MPSAKERKKVTIESASIVRSSRYFRSTGVVKKLEDQSVSFSLLYFTVFLFSSFFSLYFYTRTHTSSPLVSFLPRKNWESIPPWYRGEFLQLYSSFLVRLRSSRGGCGVCLYHREGCQGTGRRMEEGREVVPGLLEFRGFRIFMWQQL